MTIDKNELKDMIDAGNYKIFKQLNENKFVIVGNPNGDIHIMLADFTGEGNREEYSEMAIEAFLNILETLE